MLEGLRAAKVIGTSLEAEIQVVKNIKLNKIIDAFTPDELADIVIVSGFEWVDKPENLNLKNIYKDSETGFEMATGFTRGEKCPRCLSVMSK
ncbi:MAG: hypothetical protein IJ667_11080 [Synergistaceae bacterium]|nr:hypothetical protein [Synergistaceae bacterium]